MSELTHCQRCGSGRVLIADCWGRDDQCYSIGDISGYAGYAPDIPGICGGDTLHPAICLDCGQCQGEFPKAPFKLGKGEEDH